MVLIIEILLYMSVYTVYGTVDVHCLAIICVHTCVSASTTINQSINNYLSAPCPLALAARGTGPHVALTTDNDQLGNTVESS